MATVSFAGIVKTTSSKTGFIVWEEFFYDFKGEQREGKRRWTIWMNSEHTFADGDRVDVIGDLATKAVEWQTPEGETKHLVDHILNSPKVTLLGSTLPHERVIDQDDLRKYGAPF